MLHAQRNFFDGPIPSQLGQMTGLKQSLNVYQNSLSSRLPTQLGQLTDLSKYLSCYSNELSSSLPSELGQLQALDSGFSFTYNSFCGDVPTQVRALSSGVSAWVVTTGNSIGTWCPTSAPTLAPTVDCSPGQYLSAHGCTPCGVGFYNPQTDPPFPTSCLLW